MIKGKNGKRRNNGAALEEKVVRCSIYTRKSTDEGLDKDFNTLDAQREACEAFIASQRHEGWVVLPEKYDDGGFTGANTDRPALQQLIADIKAGKVDAVVVYKIDRISRSLMDFARLMDLFETYNVALVSITQAFATDNSMGRLTLNILMSFAAFERDMIAERTKDKLSAARRKGKQLGGVPVLGYTIEKEPRRHLVIVPEEAFIVREIFRIYIEKKSLLEVVRELRNRGWRNKVWKTQAGRLQGGKPFDKNSLSRLLSRHVYIGKVLYESEIYDGEHEAIIDESVFNQVQDILTENRRTNGVQQRNKYGALLRGLIRCGSCGKSMVHTYTRKPGKLYRYYTCTGAQKNGFDTCPSGTIPAKEIEDFVVRQIREIDKNPELREKTFDSIISELRRSTKALKEEQDIIKAEKKNLNDEARQLAMTLAQDNGGGFAIRTRLDEIEERVKNLEQRSRDIIAEIDAYDATKLTRQDFRKITGLFDEIWEVLTSQEKCQIMETLIEKVIYDGSTGKLDIKLSVTGQ